MAASRRTRSELQCRFSIIPNEDERHPLHVRVLKEDFSSLFGSTEETTGVIALEWSKQAKIIAGSAFLFALVYKSEELEFGHSNLSNTNHATAGNAATTQPGSQKPGESTPILYCTDDFLGHYHLDVMADVSVRPVQIFPVDRIVVGVTSDEAMKWAQSKFFSTGLLLSVCQQTVLVRQGDIFLAPHNVLFSHEDVFNMSIFNDMNVLACEPMQQGRLTVNTEIVVINQTDKTIGKSSLCDPHDPKGKENQINDLSCQPFILSDFAIGSGDGDAICTKTIEAQIGAENQNVDLELNKRHNQISKPKASLKPMVVNSIAHLWSILDMPVEDVGDIYNTVGLSLNTLRGIGLFNGSIAEIEVSTDGKSHEQFTQSKKTEKTEDKSVTKPKTRRAVRVHIAKGEEVKDGVIYLTPGLCFNICRKSLQFSGLSSTTLTIKKSPLSEETISLGTGDELSTSWSWRGTVPYAGEVHLSAVNSPNCSVSTNTSELLKEYFTIPRMVKKGDVLAISSKLDADFCCMDTLDGNLNRHPTIYFKVARIHPSLPSIHTYWVDITHSVLFQDGAVNSYIPGTMPMLLEGDLGVQPPPGMLEHLCELIEIISPHLHHRRKGDDPVPSVLLNGEPGCGKRRLTKAVAAALHLHFFQVNAHELCGDTSASTEARVKAMMSRATTYAPCILHLRNIDVFGKAADGNTEEPRTASAFHEIVRHQLAEHNKWPVVIVASTSHVKQVNLDLYEGFLHQHTIEVPNELQRQAILKEVLGPMLTIGEIDIPHMAQRTAGFVLGDIYALISQAHRHAQNRIFKYCLAGRQTGVSFSEEEDLVAAGITVTQSDFETALDNLQSAHSDSIGAPKIPQVSWDDVGGLVSVKAEILDTIQLPLQHPELLAAGLRRSGVLLYGPPGTGKTLLAKAVATECSLNFLSVKGPELINMYVGQSEENVREVFQRARSAAPCVIFFDELDSLAPNRGRSGDSGGVMDRVVSQLLAELDGMNKAADVFVIGATNRPDLLDPALLRPGRFDKLLYLGVSEDRASQLNILRALTRKFILAPEVSLERVVDQCPLNMTGADFYALCSDAMLNTLKRKISLLDQGIEVDQSQVEVEEEDFRDALATLVPSVSMAELARYQSLQSVFSDSKPRKS